MAQNVKLAVEGLQSGQFIVFVPGFDQIIQQVIETGDNAITQQKSVMPGKTIKDGHVPANQIIRPLDNG
jgi:hypothetical protein